MAEGNPKIISGRQGVLSWTRLSARRPTGMVFAPPLIGGSAGTILRRLRWMADGGWDVFSFDYAGHGRSGGGFTLSTSLRDTRTMCRCAASAAAADRLPLHGVGICFGAIPLIHAAAMGTPIGRMVLLNPIPGFSAAAAVRAFRRWWLSTRHLWPGVRGYLDTLFPFTDKGLHGFGILARHRTRLLKAFGEALHFAPLDHLRLDGTRLLCLYTTSDVIRQAAGYGCEAAYRQRIRALCPEAEFHRLDDDHYLSRQASRRRIRALTSRFLRTAGG